MVPYRLSTSVCLFACLSVGPDACKKETAKDWNLSCSCSCFLACVLTSAGVYPPCPSTDFPSFCSLDSEDSLKEDALVVLKMKGGAAPLSPLSKLGIFSDVMPYDLLARALD